MRNAHTTRFGRLPFLAAAPQRLRDLCAQHLGLPVAVDLRPARTCSRCRVRAAYQFTLRELVTAYAALALADPREAEGGLVAGGAAREAAQAVVAGFRGPEQELSAAVQALQRLLLQLPPRAALPRGRSTGHTMVMLPSPLTGPTPRAAVRFRARGRCARR